MLNLITYCISLRYSAHFLDNGLGLVLDIHMQIDVPLMYLICGLVLFFLCVLLSVSDDTDYSQLLQTEVISPKTAQNLFYL